MILNCIEIFFSKSQVIRNKIINIFAYITEKGLRVKYHTMRTECMCNRDMKN